MMWLLSALLVISIFSLALQGVIKVLRRCPDCDGDGYLETRTERSTCKECAGTGKIPLPS